MIRIVIAEDQEMLLGAMGSLLNLEEDMEVVGQASNGEEAIALVHRLQPDICIMDIEMPEMSGLEAAEALSSFGCKVIILTTFARSGYYQRALQADVSGYLLKDSPSEELASSIRSIVHGDRIYCPELIDEESINDQEHDIEVFQPRAMQQTKINTVRNYLTTILDKMKLPTG
ncbi:response regulator transcription factor [Bacillus sp. sid0103]|uniref:response regulator n=1 Tax=Bacillus sp. sid0103 TaxID=2856337 RepID=UPI001C496123|nr:response regulator transcription factor [Bacillus sp. sid0103]MBV7507870.1 response regulator transcription factor [Bacillus sp. sid0103]